LTFSLQKYSRFAYQQLNIQPNSHHLKTPLNNGKSRNHQTIATAYSAKIILQH